MTSDFHNPELYLALADPRAVAAIVAATADLTLVLDGTDVIKDISHNLDSSSGAGLPSWRGLQIEDVVRSDSRPTLRKALRTARGGKRGDRFDVSHLIEGGRDLPMQYSALGIGGDGRIILMGRDLRLVTELQSRLLASRQSLDQNARSQKQAEAHYRLLFETAADAIVIVDAGSGKVREANPRAAAMLDTGGAGVSGRKFTALFDKSRQGEVQAMLSGVLASGAPATLQLERESGDTLTLAAEIFRAGDLRLIMVRLAAPAASEPGSESGIGGLVRNAAEAIVLSDEDGKLLWANESFLALASIPLAAHALGRRLEEFFLWSGAEQDMLLKNVRQHGRVPAFATTVRSRNGQATEVELSAVAMPDATPPGYGFVMRPRSADDARQVRGNSDLTRTAENLVEMVGRVPMKDLVRDTTDVIERMCIEAALKLTGNNRASAARVLGLSRQALYLKLNRFGIADGE